MAKKTTQRDRVLQYIHDFGHITSWDAYKDLGISQLGARIFELKRRGYIFQTERVKTVNRYNQPTHYDKYFLVGNLYEDFKTSYNVITHQNAH